ncbi:MAG: NAD(P)/FAD-dependent oxidoreductase [Chloroflexota bacterium]|nr:NAD(P)/FAD-dependent oxidoreductase [Chloroflexota bacterium]
MSQTVPASDYDVIVVGGRPAGASLAARLGQQGWRVLLLEKATFPSTPAVSFPAIFASTMHLLDEMGVAEAEYARNTPPLRWWVNEFRADFRTFNRVPDLFGRDYAYAIDRARFDDALWRHASRFPSVTARQNFTVTDLLWQGERVAGVRGSRPGGRDEVFTAACVVGAGGRYGLVARKARARTFEERAELPTTVYYAYWSNAEPYDERGPVVHLHVPGHGYGFLLMDSADDTLGVGIYGQSAILDSRAAGPEALYMQLLRDQPRVWRRLAKAERVTEVRGMRNVGRLYRTAGGFGWALVGDAFYQTDPFDAQGIYDALFGAKVLSQAIDGWKRGRRWEEVIAAYEAEVRAETHARYLLTLERVKQEIYTRYPDWAWKSWLRWLNDDPDYKRRLALLMTRGIDAANWLPPSVIYRAILRGAFGDLQRLIARQARANALPPLQPSNLALTNSAG